MMTTHPATQPPAPDAPPSAPTHLAILTMFAFRRRLTPLVKPFDMADKLEALNSPQVAWVFPVTGATHTEAEDEASRAFREGRGQLTCFAVASGLKLEGSEVQA